MIIFKVINFFNLDSKQKNENLENNSNLIKDVINKYLENYKGKHIIDYNLFEKQIELRLNAETKKEIDQNELFVLEFFYKNERKYYNDYLHKNNSTIVENLIYNPANENKVKNLEIENVKNKDKLKEYLIYSHDDRSELSLNNIAAIEKDRLKSLSSYKLLTLKMEENFLSIKDDTNNKNKDKLKNSPSLNNLKNNEPSSYLGFLGNVIQNNNQSISSFISKLANFNK